MSFFALCAAAEPRLRDLAAVARDCPDDWIAFERLVKQPMIRLVGWYAEGPELLRSSAAYEAVYRHLVDVWEAAAERRARDAA